MAFIGYSFNKAKVEELLGVLDGQPEKATSFIFDCLLKTLLNNLGELQGLAEKMFELSIDRSRITLADQQVDRCIQLFK